MSVTVDTLINRALSVADVQNTTFITMVDKVDAVNEGYRYVYNLLLDNDDDYYVTEVNTSVTSTYNLPSDFLRVRAIDCNNNGVYTDVRKFSMNQRNMMQNTSAQTPYYRLKGNTLYVIPQGVAYSLRIWYYPQPTTLMSGTVLAWVTSTSYRQGDMVSNGTDYYTCLVGHTSGTFNTDLTAGYWTVYAATASTSASISYPNNIVPEIISYGAAIKFKTKGREMDKVPALQQQRQEFVEQFMTQIHRDDKDNERVQDWYAQGGTIWP